MDFLPRMRTPGTGADTRENDPTNQAAIFAGFGPFVNANGSPKALETRFAGS
jgi:hypothetical protein